MGECFTKKFGKIIQEKNGAIMNTSSAPLSLIDRLPDIRGRYSEQSSLSKTSWFRVGGPAEVLFKPADLDDLTHFLQNCPADIPVMVIGVASNMIIRDGGIKGVVIRLGRDFTSMAIDKNDPTLLHIGAASLDGNASLFAQKNGVAGLEFLSGIPGTIGAGIRMNAGCYGSEFCDVLVEATAIDRAGNIHTVAPNDIGMHYRHTDAPSDWIYTSCTLKGTLDDTEAIKARMDEIKNKREASQPIREKTGGSTFANPERDNPGAGSAWKAVDAAGCRGLTIGGAQMSEQHCNFMINIGDATATDLENLGEEVRRRVKENSGLDLRWEIKRIGEKI